MEKMKGVSRGFVIIIVKETCRYQAVVSKTTCTNSTKNSPKAGDVVERLFSLIVAQTKMLKIPLNQKAQKTDRSVKVRFAI